MDSQPVSFQFLQAITNALTDDRATIGLAHWDGASMRFAYCVDAAPQLPSHLNRVLREVEGSAKQLTAGVVNPWVELLPRAVARGGALIWGPKRTGFAADPQQHFESLCRMAGFEQRTPHQRTVTKIRNHLISLGKRLSEQYPDRVRVDHEVHAHYSMKSPLSWRNGAWSHALPCAFDDRKQGFESRLKQLIGQIQTSIPHADVPVITYASSTAPSLRADVERELTYVQQVIPRARLARVSVSGRDVETTELEQLVLSDITH